MCETSLADRKKINEVRIMTNKKITKRERFESLLTIEAVKADQGLVDFINHELELLAKKNTSDKKPTAQQVANDGIKQAILDAMEENHFYTVTELQKSVPACAELSNQRVSALLRQMKEDKLIVRTEDKRKAYFSLA
jgi:hypothetical protein